MKIRSARKISAQNSIWIMRYHDFNSKKFKSFDLDYALQRVPRDML